MKNFNMDRNHIFELTRLSKFKRSYLLKVYRSFSEDMRIDVHKAKAKFVKEYKKLVITGKKEEFNFACFVIAIKYVQRQQEKKIVNLDAIKLRRRSPLDVFNKKKIFQENYLKFSVEKRSRGVSWRKLAIELDQTFGFKISHNYLKVLTEEKRI